MPYYTRPRCIVTLSNSPAYVLMHSDKHVHSLQILALNIFTVKHNYLCTLLFTFTDNCFTDWVNGPDGPYTCTTNFQLTVSMECMMSTKSRTRVLLLAAIQSERLLVACKVFLEAFHSAHRISCICMQGGHIW
jgi:hypothetical protein